MSRWLVERRLTESAERLKRLRTELAVVEEQLAFLTEAADDTRVRALVSETPLADKEYREAQKHADAMARHKAELLTQVRDVERTQDELLDRLVAEPG
jgi:chromosome segregation ATPase